VASYDACGVQIDFGQATDPGLDPAKRVNEDSCGYATTRFGHLFVLCDGMGGHAGGKEASDIAIRTIFDQMERVPEGMDPGDALVAAVEEAGRRVYHLGGPPTNPQRPGSTCVSLLLHDGVAEVVHVGDSRAYAIRGKQIYRLTRDHSMVQELLDGGVITEQESIGHPDSNKITRALGMAPEVIVEKRPEPMELYEGDVFVLASDGLTDVARNDDILITVTEYLKDKDLGAVCTELVALANRRGGPDNITVQVIRVVKSRRPGRTVAGAPSDFGLGSAPVSRTLEGMPVIHAPMMAGVAAMSPGGIATTAPDPPAPTIVDHALHHEPMPARRMPEPVMPSRVSETRDDPEKKRLLILVLAMAGVIGLLAALLIWALYYR
jgi:PPM family protein phosphatase